MQLWNIIDVRFGLSGAIYNSVIPVCRCHTNYYITKHALGDENHVFFQQQWRRVYVHGEWRRAKRKADQKNSCRQWQRGIDDRAGHELKESTAIHEAEAQEIIVLPADELTVRAKTNSTEDE